jgi:CelD/BcsL family acetyltransferase involved in cellulose biosynthesis
MIRCDIVTPESPSDEFWDEWEQMIARTSDEHHMFGPEWFRIRADSRGSIGQWTGKCSIVAARDDDGTLRGLLALGRPRIGPLTVYATGGHDVPHRGIVATAGHEAAAGTAIGQFIADQQWPIIQIGSIRDCAPASQAMMTALKDRGVFLQHRNSQEEITLHAPDTWDEYRSEVLSSKFARKVGYYERRMARAGHVTIQHYRQPSANETATLFAALNTIESASWMSTRGAAVPRFSNPSLSNFWTQLTLGHLAPNDHIDCWVMSFNDHPVSFCFTLTNGSTRYVIANNYDDTVKDHRTGSTLYWNMIQDGIERGVRRFEFGDGDLHYKSLWGAEVESSRETYFAFPNGLVGYAASAAFRLKGWIDSRKPSEDTATETPTVQPATTELQPVSTDA